MCIVNISRSFGIEKQMLIYFLKNDLRWKKTSLFLKKYFFPLSCVANLLHFSHEDAKVRIAQAHKIV